MGWHPALIDCTAPCGHELIYRSQIMHDAAVPVHRWLHRCCCKTGPAFQLPCTSLCLRGCRYNPQAGSGGTWWMTEEKYGGPYPGTGQQCNAVLPKWQCSIGGQVRRWQSLLQPEQTRSCWSHERVQTTDGCSRSSSMACDHPGIITPSAHLQCASSLAADIAGDCEGVGGACSSVGSTHANVRSMQHWWSLQNKHCFPLLRLAEHAQLPRHRHWDGRRTAV